MLSSIIVIDDFYAEPLAVREAALRLSYPEPGPEVFYPGRTSKQTLLPPNTDEMFSFILRGVI